MIIPTFTVCLAPPDALEAVVGALDAAPTEAVVAEVDAELFEVVCFDDELHAAATTSTNASRTQTLRDPTRRILPPPAAPIVPGRASEPHAGNAHVSIS
jgi:hypothetical protein